ncbi:MAG: ATP-binding domain-containing protein, partial [Symbiobacteriaceae bacterium]|nr:ATP-binding domain-containing protein [Symbiobacteriaceae bacterium]
DQSIYSWRGADITNILNFLRDYPEAKVIKLEQNYRSTQQILDVAWHLISHNTQRTEKRLWSDRQSGDLVVLQCLEDEHAEAQAIVLEIERLLSERDLDYNDFAILYRLHSQSRVLEEKLIQRRIPYTIFSGVRFFERAEVKDIMAYLRILANPYDDQSLQRIINTPRRGIGDTTLEHLGEFATSMQLPWYAALELADAIPNLSKRVVERLQDLWQLLENLRLQQEYFSVTELTQEVLEQSGYWAALANSLKSEDQERLRNLQEFLNATSEFDKRKEENEGLLEFLEEVALLSSADTHDESKNSTLLMTFHSAKGLEFPVVFLTGMEEGLCPHSLSQGSPEEIEEERRLCYVGMTRAKDLLYLSYAQNRSLYGSKRPTEPSRFLAEVPQEMLYNRKQPSRQKVLQATLWETSPPPSLFYTQERRGMAPTTPRMVGHFVLNVKVGDRVWHKNWEEGIVISLEGSGENTIAQVEFTGVGTKLLQLKYAGLEKVEEA